MRQIAGILAFILALFVIVTQQFGLDIGLSASPKLIQLAQSLAILFLSLAVLKK